MTSENTEEAQRKTQIRALPSFDSNWTITERKMIRWKFIVIVCQVFFAFSVGLSSPWRENPLFDRYGAISFEAEKARLHNYAIQINNAPGSRGFIVVYSGGDWTPSYVEWRARRAVKYLTQKKGVRPDRITWRYDAHCKSGSVLLYLFYPNEASPEQDTKCIRAL